MIILWHVGLRGMVVSHNTICAMCFKCVYCNWGTFMGKSDYATFDMKTSGIPQASHS